MAYAGADPYLPRSAEPGWARHRVDVPLVTRSFLSTTIVRDVAVSEFTIPPGRGGPALLEIDVPVGTPAIWVPPLGDPMLAYQGELLLPRRLPLSVRASRDEAGILVVDCEVQP